MRRPIATLPEPDTLYDEKLEAIQGFSATVFIIVAMAIFSLIVLVGVCLATVYGASHGQSTFTESED